MYRLTRDDGAELELDCGLWEDALELAFDHGWRPAGTEAPLTKDWRGFSNSMAAPVWNSRDYFSRRSQHVRTRDAHALADAVERALRRDGSVDEDAHEPVSELTPVRAPTHAGLLSPHRRKAISGLATFAGRGGFTIGESIRLA